MCIRDREVLRGREFALRVQFLEKIPNGIRSLLVVVLLQEGPIGREVADVAVAGVAHGTEAKDRLVATIARTEDIFARRFRSFAEKDAALHFRRLRRAGDGEHCRRKVDCLDETVIDKSGLKLLRRGERFWPANEQRNVQSFFVTELFGPHHGLPVVAEENNDGIFRHTVDDKLREDQSNLAIEFGGAVEVLRPVLSRHRMIGIVRRNDDLRRIGFGWRVELPMRLLEIDLREKWLMRFE